MYFLKRTDPGGDDELLKGVGKDGTNLVQKYHAWGEFVHCLFVSCLLTLLGYISQRRPDARQVSRRLARARRTIALGDHA